MNMFLKITIVALSMLLSGCVANKVGLSESGDNIKADGEKGDMELTSCTDPRPEICTTEYAPVCGQLNDGTFKTAATGCVACSSEVVVGYRVGACE